MGKSVHIKTDVPIIGSKYGVKLNDLTNLKCTCGMSFLDINYNKKQFHKPYCELVIEKKSRTKKEAIETYYTLLKMLILRKGCAGLDEIEMCPCQKKLTDHFITVPHGFLNAGNPVIKTCWYLNSLP